MGCRLFGAKPLSEPMLEYCYTPRNQIQWNFNRNANMSIEKSFVHKKRLLCLDVNEINRALWSILYHHIAQYSPNHEALMLQVCPCLPPRLTVCRQGNCMRAASDMYYDIGYMYLWWSNWCFKKRHSMLFFHENIYEAVYQISLMIFVDIISIYMYIYMWIVGLLKPSEVL